MAQTCEKDWLNVSKLRNGRGERVVKGKDPRCRFICECFGASVGGKVQGAGGQEPEVEVEPESSPGPAGDPRSPKAKQVWVR